MILDRINYPSDLKDISIEDLNILADEMRQLIIKKVNTTGGHMGPNLGIIEATIALHYVFNTPIDKIIYDVSHQCYPHKILTGRKEGFLNPELYHKYSGYTAPEESEYDIFKVGHTSTSVSLATGVAKARDLKGENYNVIALIGDGSLSGGEALEGLDNAATLGSNIIIVVNDNEMSIAENHGGLYDNLKLLRQTNGKAECNFFKSLNFDYYYVDKGNNIEDLIEAFQSVKDRNRPTVVHIHTLKGKGLDVAVNDKESFHWIMPGTLDKKDDTSSTPVETYETVTKDYIMDRIRQNPATCVVNAGTPGVFWFNKEFRDKLGNHYTDVGIAEEHAVAYSSAMAKCGAKPILCIMSSFVQRTYDQMSQDLCLNNSPLTMLIYWGGLMGADATHLCSFDIPLIANIPNMVYLAPTNKEEYIAMLDYAQNQTEHPVAIRIPVTPLKSSNIKDETDYSKLNKFKLVEKGEKIAIIGLGSFFDLACDVRDEIKSRTGVNSTVINPKFITGVDSDLLENLKKDHKIVITIEDGMIDGGFGEKITRFYGNSDMKVLNFGGKKEFTDRVGINELYERYHLTKEHIAQDTLECLKMACGVA